MSLIDKLRKQDRSLDDQASEVRQAWNAIPGAGETWVREVYDSYVIVCAGEEHYRIDYARGDTGISFNIETATPVEMTWAEVSKAVKIEKTDDDRQICFGWAYVTAKGRQQIVDHSGEFVDDPRVLEDAAYAFNLYHREGDERHTETVKAQLIESLMVTDEKLEAWATIDGELDVAKLEVLKETIPSAWWTGWYIEDPELFAKVKDGTYPMLSIGGWAEREVVHAAA